MSDAFLVARIQYYYTSYNPLVATHNQVFRVSVETHNQVFRVSQHNSSRVLLHTARVQSGRCTQLARSRVASLMLERCDDVEEATTLNGVLVWSVPSSTSDAAQCALCDALLMLRLIIRQSLRSDAAKASLKSTQQHIRRELVSSERARAGTTSRVCDTVRVAIDDAAREVSLMRSADARLAETFRRRCGLGKIEAEGWILPTKQQVANGWRIE